MITPTPFRSIIIGLTLGLGISRFTYFNDAIIRQTWFISNHLPLCVFGAVVLLLLAVNPLLRLVGRRWPLSAGEVAIITALALAACGWPSFNFYWGFIPNTAMPAHWHKNAPHWQAHHVMSYVPGGSALLAQGHVRDWPELSRRLVDAAPGTPEARWWNAMDASAQHELQSAAEHGRVEPEQVGALLDGLNRALAIRDIYDSQAFGSLQLPGQANELIDRAATSPLSEHEVVRLNRWLLVATLPQLVLPPPAGDGVLLAGGRDDVAVLDMIVQGRPSDQRLNVLQLPWRTWWPTLSLWGGMGLLLGLAALFLAMIVHQQWSRHELLPYPVARFVEEISERDEGAALPRVVRERLFWTGFLAMVVIHSVNGLHAWFPGVPAIPLKLDLYALTQLFPNASRVYGADHLFRPYLYFTVIAFSFFLVTSVSLSLGIAQFVYISFGAFLLAAGIGFNSDYLGANKGNLLRFGAYLGMAMIIVYVGRRYYVQVLKGMVGLGNCSVAPGYAIWAARGLAVVVVLAIGLLHQAGLDWFLGTLFVLLVLLTFLVLSRIVAETGMFFVQAWWTPVGMLTAMLGIEAIGPTAYVILGLASIMLVGDPRTALMPYLANGLRMVERSRRGSVGAITPWLGVMIVSGFIVAGAATFLLVHNRGVNHADDWATRTLPSLVFDTLSLHLSDMTGRGTLVDAASHSGVNRLAAIHISPDVYGWVLLGLALLVLTAAARLRLACWPIHPVLFLVWGSMPAARFAGSFLIGCAVKGAVVRLGGARAYRAMMPLMVGVIAGEVLIGLVWITIGAVYYFNTDLTPPSYRIFP